MRIVTIILTLLLSLLSASLLHASSTNTLEGTVSRVLDGDTLLLVSGAKTIKVRLFGIDAPEIRWRVRQGQPFGPEAKEALEKKIGGNKVTIDVLDVDKNRLVIGVVKFGTRDIDCEMIEEGWAWAYRQHLKESFASRYVSAENRARKKRLGLWRQENPQSPWSFRLDQKLHRPE